MGRKKISKKKRCMFLRFYGREDNEIEYCLEKIQEIFPDNITKININQLTQSANFWLPPEVLTNYNNEKELTLAMLSKCKEVILQFKSEASKNEFLSNISKWKHIYLEYGMCSPWNRKCNISIRNPDTQAYGIW